MKITDKKAASLIVAILFTSAFMLVVASLGAATLATIDSVKNRETSGKVKYVAEALAEIGAYESAKHEVGWSSENAIDDIEVREAVIQLFQSLGMTDCVADPASCASLKIVGKPAASDQITLGGTSYYSVPIKGTGNAAETCLSPDDANDGCHWNRLSFGESVEIPLYYEDESGAPVKLDLSTSDFKLRVRAPACTGLAAEGCVDRRVQLFPMAETSIRPRFYRRIDKDPVLIQWLISDEGGDQTLVAGDYSASDPPGSPSLRPPSSDIANSIKNTEITGGRVNEANDIAPRLMDAIILDKTQKGNDVLDKIYHPTIEAFMTSSSISKPVIRLSLVGQPRKDDDNPSTPTDSQYDDFLNDKTKDISYLEYQLLTTDNKITDNKTQIEVSIRIGEFSTTIRRNADKSATLGGFVLESF